MAQIQWDTGISVIYPLIDAEIINRGGGYEFKAKHSGYCLDVYAASAKHGENVVQASCHGGKNQTWSIGFIDGAYLIKAKHSGLCLTVYCFRRNLFNRKNRPLFIKRAVYGNKAESNGI